MLECVTLSGPDAAQVMPPKKRSAEPANLAFVNIKDPANVRYWSEYFKVDPEKLRRAVLEAGPNVFFFRKWIAQALASWPKRFHECIACATALPPMARVASPKCEAMSKPFTLTLTAEELRPAGTRG
jgi:hypothetical protein